VKIDLPREDGSLVPYTLGEPRACSPPAAPATSRVAYAAAHVVVDPFADPDTIDWATTLAFRRHLWSYGLGVAEAMDTAQRGMGLDWAAARELIARSGAEARACGERIVCGAGTDQLPPGPAPLDWFVAAYEEQLAVIEEAGGTPVLMASRGLAASAAGPDDYAKVYGRLLAQVARPAVLDWLGPMFDPALEGYWGSAGLDAAADSVLAIITGHADKVDGIKVSLLDADREVALRRRLPAGVRALHGRRLQLPRADPRGRRGAQRRSAGHLRPDRARRGRRADRARRRRPRRVRPDPRADRAACPAHLRDAT
jgi:hypothetical protein